MSKNKAMTLEQLVARINRAIWQKTEARMWYLAKFAALPESDTLGRMISRERADAEETKAAMLRDLLR